MAVGSWTGRERENFPKLVNELIQVNSKYSMTKKEGE